MVGQKPRGRRPALLSQQHRPGGQRGRRTAEIDGFFCDFRGHAHQDCRQLDPIPERERQGFQLVDAGDRHVVAPEGVEAECRQYCQTGEAQHRTRPSPYFQRARQEGSTDAGGYQSNAGLLRVYHSAKDQSGRRSAGGPLPARDLTLRRDQKPRGHGRRYRECRLSVSRQVKAWHEAGV